MTEAVNAFMNEMIDYAGYFPPENLDLETAIDNFARYRTEEDAWMLGRFIVPYGKLKDLEKLGGDLFDNGFAFGFSILGETTDTAKEFNRMINKALEACQKFSDRYGSSVSLDMLETKLPRQETVTGDKSFLKEIIHGASVKFADTGWAPDRLFFETYLSDDREKTIENTIEVLAEVNNTPGSDPEFDVGYKLRCGGAEKKDFPGTDQVAEVIKRTRDKLVPLKCTAGLHHAIRTRDESIQVDQHGFVNLFGGALLYHNESLDSNGLRKILEEKDAGAFKFTDQEFSWNGRSIGVEQIKNFRKELLVSFGSCSFEEPRDELREFGWLS